MEDLEDWEALPLLRRAFSWGMNRAIQTATLSPVFTHTVRTDPSGMTECPHAGHGVSGDPTDVEYVRASQEYAARNMSLPGTAKD